ncbi:MAG: amidohydrolase family protein [Candidatus Glassbacteria bacterium]|nr:amidohydrolase family protein [Candidatus Glassbacteria bacterium]
MRNFRFIDLLLWCLITAPFPVFAVNPGEQHSLYEVNNMAQPDSMSVVAIVGVTLIDGLGGDALPDAAVIVQGNRIIAVGPRSSLEIPAGAEKVNGRDLTLLPGLIDAHFHLNGNRELPLLFLRHGITSIRDPGAWIESYDPVRQAGTELPRLFLSGPHLDNPPPAYPKNSMIVRDAHECRDAVNRFIDQGASVIKAYFRLPLGLIQVAAQTAHARGVPVTAHLEIVDAGDGIRAGLDGIEHITSCGTALVPLRQAEQFRQAILADNNARREGRYELWSDVDLTAPRVQALIDLMVGHGIYLVPNLAVFERRSGDKGITDMHLQGFSNMMAFTRMAHRAGVRIVVGSHSSVPHAERGWAYQREMEMLVETGMTPREAITAATIQNARFFRTESRTGSIEVGKLADLVLVEGNPLNDIRSMRRIQRVMLNGIWISTDNTE